MTIAHIIASIDIAMGGPPRSATHLLSALGHQYSDLNIQLHTYNSRNPIIENFKYSNVTLSFYELKSLRRLDGLEESLVQTPISIYHGQGIWDLPIHQMARLARKHKTPYIITPRGMLESWSLQQSKIKKQLALTLYQYKDLKNATCLHATGQMEADSIRALGLENPVAIIPNGVPIEDFEIKDYRRSSDSKKLLFLSRIHLKKGIEILIEAWGALSPKIRKVWHIDVVGNGDFEYIKKLKNLIVQKGLEGSINIKPPVYDDEKGMVYQNADIFVLPTHSENFGIVIAEALACGIPVITTKGAPWEDLETHKCGWWIDIGVDSLKNALEEALVLPDDILEDMGIRGRTLVEKKYSMHHVAEQMHELYQWVDGNIEKPIFVI